jgi:hypothetical protein
MPYQSPHAGLLRPIARAEVHQAAHHHVRAARVHAPAAVVASSTASAGAASSSIPPAGSSSEPIATVVLGPMVPFVVTEVQVQISQPMTAPAPIGLEAMGTAPAAPIYQLVLTIPSVEPVVSDLFSVTLTPERASAVITRMDVSFTDITTVS